MAIVLFNPTNEEFKTQYVGEDVIIKPMSKIRVDDPRGRHVLNILGPRGLVTLEYGDEGAGEEKKAEVGRQRNREFKMKQVLDFNQLNEQRFQSKLGYINPQAHIKQYANELGIELRQPYAVPEAAKEDMARALQRNQELEREVKEKDTRLQDLEGQVGELTAMVKKLVNLSQGKPAEDAPDSKGLAGKWRTMGGNVLAAWIRNNWEGLQMLSDEEMKDLEDRFKKVYNKTMPKDPEELESLISKAA